MSDNVGKKWEQSFHEQDAALTAGASSAYEIKGVPKSFFTSYSQSPYIELLVKYAKLKKGSTILEAGCGSGKLSVVLATMGFKVTALDFSKKMLKNVESLKKQAEKHFGKLQMDFVQGDLGDLKLTKKYDAVFNEGVVEHWLDHQDRIHVISQMKKVTKKDGTVAVFVPNGANPFHFWWVATRFSGYMSAPKMTRYSTKKLKNELKAAGLKKIETDGFDTYYSFNKWPRLPLLDYPIGYLEKHHKPAKPIREFLGTMIAAMGKNK